MAAYEWISSSPPAESEAFVSRITGNIHWSSNMIDLDGELPEDIGDGSIYVSVPHKYELNLGRNLALTFAEEQLANSYNTATAATFLLHRTFSWSSRLRMVRLDMRGFQ